MIIRVRILKDWPNLIVNTIGIIFLSFKKLEDYTMGNRRIEVYEYRQIIFRMRQGESDRAIVRAGLASSLISDIRDLE